MVVSAGLNVNALRKPSRMLLNWNSATGISVLRVLSCAGVMLPAFMMASPKPRNVPLLSMMSGMRK